MQCELSWPWSFKENSFCYRSRKTVVLSDLLHTFIPINKELETHFVSAFGVIFFSIASNEFFLDNNFFIRYSSFPSLSKENSSIYKIRGYFNDHKIDCKKAFFCTLWVTASLSITHRFFAFRLDIQAWAIDRPSQELKCYFLCVTAKKIFKTLSKLCLISFRHLRASDLQKKCGRR